MNVTEVYGGRATIKFHEAKHYYTVTVPGRVKDLYQPSVTTILGMKDKSNALIPWAVNAMTERVRALIKDAPDSISKIALDKILDLAQESYRKKTQDACDVGTVAHRVLEQELLHRAGLAAAPELPVRLNPTLAPNITAEMVDQINHSIEAGKKFFDEHRIDVVQAESPRWSPTYGYIGTGDVIAHFDGDLAVIDYKTSKAIYSEYFLQTAAYQKAYVEEFPEQTIVKRVIVHIGRDGKLATEERGNDTVENDFHAFLGLLKVWRWNQENQGKYSKPAPQVVGPLTQN